MSLWLAPSPLVLASGSAARRALLQAAALPIEIIKPQLDEAPLAEALVRRAAPPREIAQALAKAKGEAVSRAHPERLVLAADQTLDLDGVLGMKAPSLAAARSQLQALRARTHQLHSAAVLMQGGTLVWSGVESASLTMRAFSDAFLDTYLGLMGQAALATVGAYELEALGPHLFSSVVGSHACILGLPMAALLDALRAQGALLA